MSSEASPFYEESESIDELRGAVKHEAMLLALEEARYRASMQRSESWFWRLMVSLAGASPDALKHCPPHEQQTYFKLGFTVLIPFIMGTVAAYTTMGELMEGGGNVLIKLLAGLTWGTGILILDIAIMSQLSKRWVPKIHRDAEGVFAKLGMATANTGKFFASLFIPITRLLMAGLLGFIVSHALVLALFKHRIVTHIEEKRAVEVDALKVQQQDEMKAWLAQNPRPAPPVAPGTEDETTKVDSEMEATKNAVPAAPQDTPISAVKVSLSELETTLSELEAERTRAVTEAERLSRKAQDEMSGRKTTMDNEELSSIPGDGPRAASYRREAEVQKQRALALDVRIQRISAEVLEQMDKLALLEQERRVWLSAEAEKLAAQEAERREAERLQRETLQKLAQEKYLADLKAYPEIESAWAARRDEQEALQMQAMRELLDQPRRDMLFQTAALEEILEENQQLNVLRWIFLLCVFLVDTFPVLLKFLRRAGSYDMLLARQQLEFSEYQDYLFERNAVAIRQGQIDIHLLKRFGADNAPSLLKKSPPARVF